MSSTSNAQPIWSYHARRGGPGGGGPGSCSTYSYSRVAEPAGGSGSVGASVIVRRLRGMAHFPYHPARFANQTSAALLPEPAREVLGGPGGRRGSFDRGDPRLCGRQIPPGPAAAQAQAEGEREDGGRSGGAGEEGAPPAPGPRKDYRRLLRGGREHPRGRVELSAQRELHVAR